MLGDGKARPVVRASGRIVARLIAHKVDAELAPRNEFVEIAVSRRLEARIFLRSGVDGKCDGEWANVAKMEIGRERAGTVDFRVIAVTAVVRQHGLAEFLKPLHGGVVTAVPGFDGVYAAIEIVPATRDVSAHVFDSELFGLLPGMQCVEIFVRNHELRQSAI